MKPEQLVWLERGRWRRHVVPILADDPNGPYPEPDEGRMWVRTRKGYAYQAPLEELTVLGPYGTSR